MCHHYNDFILSVMASQITGVSISLLNGFFGRRSKKTSKFHITGLCAGNLPVNSLHKGPVTRKMFQFDDIIMFGFGWGTELCLFLWYIFDSKKPANQQNYAWTKMDIALQRTLSNAFPFNEKKSISIYDSLRFVFQSPFDNQVALAQVIWFKTSTKGPYQYKDTVLPV